MCCLVFFPETIEDSTELRNGSKPFCYLSRGIGDILPPKEAENAGQEEGNLEC